MKKNKIITVFLGILISFNIQGSYHSSIRSHNIEYPSKVPSASKFIQGGRLYVMYPNRFGSTSVADSKDFKEDIKYQLSHIPSVPKKNAYREKLAKLGLITERPEHMYTRLATLSDKHKGGFKLF